MDINDNDPKFEVSQYQNVVPEDITVGSEVARGKDKKTLIMLPGALMKYSFNIIKKKTPKCNENSILPYA